MSQGLKTPNVIKSILELRSPADEQLLDERAAPALYKESWILGLDLRACKRAGQRKMPSKGCRIMRSR